MITENQNQGREIMTSNPVANMPSTYDASEVERKIYDKWLSQNYFSPSAGSDDPSYCIIMPPPNVTGELHLGHALEKSLEDALIRWRRMRGRNTLWLPGTDHAGIATQWAVERELAAEGRNRHELGRDKFVELVWEHVKKYGGIIHEQSRRLGISADWDRHKFTLDEGPSKAVRTTFVNLYNKGRIYRHERIINWCPRCATALSDLEVNYQDQDDKLFFIKYKLVCQSEAYITVATTRPETMLGDTAVAVNPNDLRYQHLVGQQVLLPIVGRFIPVVGDDSIQEDFGTGALKVTPAHDPVDFEIGQRHNLESVSVIGLDGCMNSNAGEYLGVDRFEARRAILEELETLGLLETVQDLNHAVGHCQRCDSVVEPLVSLQWFLNVGKHDDPNSIAGKAYDAVKNGEIKIVPERFSRVYLNWLENIRDWCISRQLWWGHRIPVWYCGDCSYINAAVDPVDECSNCGSKNLHQDQDVLDTWFSSGLWPHSTLGWPDETDDFKRFYPTTVLECGYDILFFWVARMIMMGLENTGQVPFRTVFLHGLIRDANGAKMSKTRGNTMDPLELVDRYGTDALRFALTTGTGPGNDMRIGDGKLEAARNFANKIWNASRYVISAADNYSGLVGQELDRDPKHREDRWIISLLDRLTRDVNEALEHFELGDAQQKLHDFFWNDFCDWYIEMAKVRLRDNGLDSPVPTLVYTLERALRLLHPFMPFITEEIWGTLMDHITDQNGSHGSIMLADYPVMPNPIIDVAAEQETGLVIQTIRSVRNIRSQLRVPANEMIDAVFEATEMRDTLEEAAPIIKSLCRLRDLQIEDQIATAGLKSSGITSVVYPWTIRLPLDGVVDLATEINRLEQELESSNSNLRRIEALVSNPNFRAKAKPEVVENEEGKLKTLKQESQHLEEMLAQLNVV